MKLLVKKILFGIAVVLGVVATLIFKTPLHSQTDLISLIDINDAGQQWPVNKISDKFSSVINIVVESRDEKVALQSANKIINLLNTEDFNDLKVQSNNFSLKSVTKDLIPYKSGLLSAQDKEFLQQNQSRKIADNAIKQVSQSMMPLIVPLREDPFLLLSNYLLNINNGNIGWTLHNGLLWQYNDSKHYFMIPVDVVNTKTTNKQINSLRQELLKFNDENHQVYISGVPLHTAAMVQKSQVQLTVLSLLAALMAILFSYLLFRKMFTIMIVLGSLSVGFLCGTIALFLCFNTPHILTFVFGTTLIGLGIDYSFHFLTSATLKNQIQIRKNMWHSFLTTLVCFLPLMFSGVSLLQQISVFTITGLTTIYVGLGLFIPKKIKLETKPLKINFSLSRKSKIAILSLITVAIITTLPFVRKENNMNQLYRPDAQILADEVMVQKLTKSTESAVLMVRGKNIQEILETEENIKQNGNEFFSLSNIIPSMQIQQENEKLIKQLYKTQSKYLKQKLELKNTPTFESGEYMTPDNINSEFLNNWINKLIIKDENYIYSLAQVSPDIQINNENAKVVSVSKILSDKIEQYSHETYRLLGICAVCLFILLSLFYKKRAIIYLIPSFLAILLSVCILTWIGQPITFFHMLAFFIVIGLGLDYTIFNINADNDKETRPVLFSFLTSFVGFGLLAFTSFFLIKSMGITLGLGLGLSYLISFFLFRTHKVR